MKRVYPKLSITLRFAAAWNVHQVPLRPFTASPAPPLPQPRAAPTPPHPQHLTKLEKDGAAEPYRLLPFNLSIFGFPLHSLLFTRWYPTCSAE